MDAVGATDPRRCVFVGDRLFDDIWGAGRLGMRTVHVPHSDIPLEQHGHTEGEPDAVVHELGELLGVVEVELLGVELLDRQIEQRLRLDERALVISKLAERGPDRAIVPLLRQQRGQGAAQVVRRRALLLADLAHHLQHLGRARPRQRPGDRQDRPDRTRRVVPPVHPQAERHLAAAGRRGRPVLDERAAGL